MMLKTYSDGASRGNPGHAAIAYMILDENEKILKKHAKYIGVKTNNQAEYDALISTLEAAIELEGKKIIHHMDSELVVKQLTKKYKVRNQQLKKLWLRVQELNNKFQEITFTYLPRTNKYIQEVDKLANITLNSFI